MTDRICECLACGRMHRWLANPPWALSHADLCHLSRSFKTDYRSSQDQRINEWLKRLIAQATSERPHIPHVTEVP